MPESASGTESHFYGIKTRSKTHRFSGLPTGWSNVETRPGFEHTDAPSQHQPEGLSCKGHRPSLPLFTPSPNTRIYNPHPIKIYKGHAANRRSGVPNYQVTLVSLHRPTPFQYRDFNSTEMRFTSRYPGPKRGPPGHCRSTNRKPTSMNGDGYRFTLSGGEFDWTHG